MPAPQEIVDLVDRFQRNRESYDDARFNEMQTRIQFLNPMFKALGWDVDNTSGYAEAYKDVVHEDALRGGSVTIAPDFCFRVGGARKFFLEAKKPSVNLKMGVNPAFQLRRYAWSAKLPVSVLSNFSVFLLMRHGDVIQRAPLFGGEQLEDVAGGHAAERVEPVLRKMQSVPLRNQTPRAPVQRHGVGQRSVTIKNQSFGVHAFQIFWGIHFSL